MPTDAFEMSYVFTDGEGATDNNQGKNYMTPVQGSMTLELWEEKAVERLVTSPSHQLPDAHPTDVLCKMCAMLVYPSSCMQCCSETKLVGELHTMPQAGAATLLCHKRRTSYGHCASSIRLH